jgi:sulfoxide reductase heme-binding subunit YedZ
VRRRELRWLRIAVHVGALAPLAALGWMAWRDQLGPVPVAAATRLLGRYALALLLLSLVPTAVRIGTGFGALIRVRRALGLYAFLYALLHFLAFAGLDYGFDLDLLATVIAESSREIVGLAALVILAILAVTSLRSLMRGLGRYWKLLHRSVYLAAALVVLHYVWNYKELRAWPVAAGAALLLLLIPRLPPVENALRRRRREERGPTR